LLISVDHVYIIVPEGPWQDGDFTEYAHHELLTHTFCFSHEVVKLLTLT